MDAINIATKTPLKANENLLHLIDTVFKYRYQILSNTYVDGFQYPDLEIRQGGDIDSVDLTTGWVAGSPYIRATVYDENGIYQEDGNFPVRTSGEIFYPIFAFSCRESMFLLDFILKLFSENEDYCVIGVNLKLMSYTDLKKCFVDDDPSWAYTE